MVSEPILLTDKTRLQEIYNLRVDAWESAPTREVINRKLFPNGWFDELDDEAFHWVIENEDHKIIAAARLNIFENINKNPYKESLSNLPVAETDPSGFYSRLVIHPAYQGLGLSKKLVSSRNLFCEQNNVTWLQVLITNEKIKKLFGRLNFKVVGKVEVNYHGLTKRRLVDMFVKECVKPKINLNIPSFESAYQVA